MHFNRQVFNARLHDLLVSTIAELDGVGVRPASKAEPKARSHFSEFGPSVDSTKATGSARLKNFSPAQLNDRPLCCDSFDLQIAAIPLITGQAFITVTQLLL